jgi:putative transposase
MVRKQGSEIWISIAGMAVEDSTGTDPLQSGKIARCKLCGSDHIVKYGLSKGIQCWWCKDCRHKFVDNKADPGMKLPKELIAFTLSMYYEGMGFTTICRYLKEKYKTCPSNSTIYSWLMRFSEKVVIAAKRECPQVSDEWLVTLTPVKVGSENVWFWDVLDVKTRFLLASHVSKTLTSKHARKTLDLAVKKARKIPQIVLTDQLSWYPENPESGDINQFDGIRFQEFLAGSRPRFLQSYWSSIKARETILKSFKDLKSAKTVIGTWAVHYNYLRPDEVTTNSTPAYRAGIHTHLKAKLR